MICLAKLRTKTEARFTGYWVKAVIVVCVTFGRYLSFVNPSVEIEAKRIVRNMISFFSEVTILLCLTTVR